MQVINLDDKYRIVSSHMNWILQKYEEITHRVTKEVRRDWKDIGYFGENLAYALKRYTRLSQLDDESEHDVHKVVERLKELEEVIVKQVRKENIQLVLKSDTE